MPRKARPWWRRLKADGAGEWYVTIKGKQERLHVTDRNDEAAAFAAFQRLLEKAKATPAGRPEPIAELAAEWLDSKSHRIADKTRTNYSIQLDWLIAQFGSRAAAEIDPIALEKRAAAEGWSDSHRANILWTAQAFLRWCGCNVTLERPAHESRGDSAVIAPEVYTKLLRHCYGDFHQLCRVLWMTGARPMEAASLKAEDIDWPNGTATRKQHKTKKKGKRRVLYFTTECLTVIREQSDKYNSGPLFRGWRGEAFTARALTDRFRRLSAKIGAKVRSYDFRHSYITRSLMAGVPSAVVAALVGNSVAMIDKYYGHVGVNAAPLREAAERAAG